MHEYSVVLSLLDAVEEHAVQHGEADVHQIRVCVGELSGVEPELLVSAFDICRQTSKYPHAKLEIVPVTARWGCQRCGLDLEPGSILRCPKCERPATLVEGGEIILDHLELEVH